MSLLLELFNKNNGNIIKNVIIIGIIQ